MARTRFYDFDLSGGFYYFSDILDSKKKTGEGRTKKLRKGKTTPKKGKEKKAEEKKLERDDCLTDPQKWQVPYGLPDICLAYIFIAVKISLVSSKYFVVV